MAKLFDEESTATQTASQSWTQDTPYSIEGNFDGCAVVMQVSYDAGTTWRESGVAHFKAGARIVHLQTGVQWRFDLRNPGTNTSITLEI